MGIAADGRQTPARLPTRRDAVGVEADEELVEIVAAELPVEGFGHRVVALLERGEPFADLVEVGEVVGVDDFALHDGEVDLALIQPGGVHRQVDEPQRRPLALQPIDGTLAAVAGAVVHDPEHPLSDCVGLDGHDLFDETAERGDAGGGLAAAHHLGPVHVIGGEVGERATPFVLVLDAHQPGPTGGQRRMAAAAGLDAGLLIGADHELAAHPTARLRTPGRTDPTPPPPWPRSSGLEGRSTTGGTTGGWRHGQGPATPSPPRWPPPPPASTSSRASSAQLQRDRRHPGGGGQLAGQLLDLSDHQRGETGSSRTRV